MGLSAGQGLVAFNVYLEARERFGSYLDWLRNIAGGRALIMNKLGLDSLCNGEEAQGVTLVWQIRATASAGCAGVIHVPGVAGASTTASEGGRRTGPDAMTSLPLMQEWWLVAGALAGVAAIGFAWPPLFLALPPISPLPPDARRGAFRPAPPPGLPKLDPLAAPLAILAGLPRG